MSHIFLKGISSRDLIHAFDGIQDAHQRLVELRDGSRLEQLVAAEEVEYHVGKLKNIRFNKELPILASNCLRFQRIIMKGESHSQSDVDMNDLSERILAVIRK